MRSAVLFCAFVVMGTSVVDAQRGGRGGRRPRRTPVPLPQTPEPAPVTTPVPAPVPTAATPAPVPQTSTPPATTTVPVPVPTAATPAPELDFGNARTRPGQAIAAASQAQYLPVVATIVQVIEQQPGSFRPLLVRLAWHSLATYNEAELPIGGSNGGCIRSNPELSLADNRGVDVAVNALEAVKRAHPFVTYADLYQLAGNTALEYMGSPSLFFRPGRRDFVVPAETNQRCVSDNERLPQKHMNNDAFPHPETLDYFFERFGNLGISLDNDPAALEKMVSLMGGHNMGAMHLEISNNEGQWTADNLVFGVEYFFNLENGPWGRNTAQTNGPFDLQYLGGPRPRFTMLPIDMVMRADNRLRNLVRQFSTNQRLYETHFVAAWRQIQENGVDFA
eukprot:TRINITY_DN1388_c0_g1_i7.p1 TRINITY_DN1388_c0_g1~~TRINITY_DN1388_c0_g1_i7.p1  ORF type:complete len:392 (+),score=146.10 TRINITY_DN1388_c0_g1_i7:55-1230(+)